MTGLLKRASVCSMRRCQGVKGGLVTSRAETTERGVSGFLGEGWDLLALSKGVDVICFGGERWLTLWMTFTDHRCSKEDPSKS